MNILCANFLHKSAYWVRKISLGKIIGGGGARAPCAPPGSYAHVQADWRRSCTYGRAPNPTGISQGSLTCPPYTDTGPPFLYGESDTPSHLVAFYDTGCWGYGGRILDNLHQLETRIWQLTVINRQLWNWFFCILSFFLSSFPKWRNKKMHKAVNTNTKR